MSIVIDGRDTVMGRAVTRRARAVADALPAAPPPTTGAELDLTAAPPPPLPDDVRAAARAALDRGETHYTTRPGISALRESIARRLTVDGFPATLDTVLITNGGAEALYIALQTLLAPGQRIAVPGLVPANLLEMLRFVGAVPVATPADLAARFVPSVEAITAVNASALLLASPSPISGLALPPGDLEWIIATAIDRDMTVILDRSYASALYDSGLARFGDAELGAKVVTIGSFSPGYGLAGWRVGWLAAPLANMKALRELKQAMSICTTAVSQYAALAALDGPDDWIAARRADFARRRDQVMTRLGATELVAVAPDAYPWLLIDIQAADRDDRAFADRLRAETGVVVAAGSVLAPAAAGSVRIDLGTSEATLRNGIERIVTFATRGNP